MTKNFSIPQVTRIMNILEERIVRAEKYHTEHGEYPGNPEEHKADLIKWDAFKCQRDQLKAA